MTWAAVAALAAVCVFMRVAVPLGLGDRRPPWLDRALRGALAPLLAALVATGALTDARTVELDPRAAGVAAALLLAYLRAPLPLVVLAAAALTAALR